MATAWHGVMPGGDVRPARSRLTIALLLVATIALGLSSRRFAHALPGVVGAYAGDTLWATMVFWLLALAFARAASMRLGAGALGVATAVELSQLHHAPWLDAIRATRPGALALGHGFLWSDLACYAAGVGIAVLLDRRGVAHLSLAGRARHSSRGASGEAPSMD